MSASAIQPVCVFALDDGGQEPDLEELLCTDDLKDLKVVVISVAGRYRQGKSFLLNFMIRFLRAGGTFIHSANESDDLQGFEWKCTRQRVTTGVSIWPEVFKLKLPDGESVAVVLMDTQGVFDTETNLKDSTSIFSFSVLLSSVQIFNVKGQINGDDLSHLELFSQYGRLLGKNASQPGGSSEAFQDLVFLIRDWRYGSDVPYGWEGGQCIIEEEMSGVGLSGEQLSMRSNIRGTFNTLRGFLMPYPGDTVSTSPDFRGSFKDVSDVHPDFLPNMEKFLSGVLTPERLVPKKINGRHVTLQEWCSYLSVYSRHLRSDELPVPKALFQATVDATNTTMLKKCFDSYCDEMSRFLDEGPVEEHLLRAKHEASLDEAVKAFRSSSKMGDGTLWKALEDELKKNVSILFERQFSKLNQSLLSGKLIEIEVKRMQREVELLQEQDERRDNENKALERRIEQMEAENLTAKLTAEERGAEYETHNDEKLESLRKEFEHQKKKSAEESAESRKRRAEIEAQTVELQEKLNAVEAECKELKAAGKKKGFWRTVWDGTKKVFRVVATVASVVLPLLDRNRSEGRPSLSPPTYSI